MKTFILKICLMIGLCIIVFLPSKIGECNLVYADDQGTQYQYDLNGRIVLVFYPNGTKVEYQYDKNGNVTQSMKKVNEKKEEINSEMMKGKGFNKIYLRNTQLKNLFCDTAEEKLIYSKFQKRKLVIKSVKRKKEKGKYYIKIQMKQINAWDEYGETSYQIKYATNSKFKKAKTIKVNRKNKKSITKESWKVKKNKTYYIKARACIQTRTGKMVYSKYSSIKKIEVGK